jgi:hypothetical protein
MTAHDFLIRGDERAVDNVEIERLLHELANGRVPDDTDDDYNSILLHGR